MTNNTYFFWVGDSQLPFIQEQFKDFSEPDVIQVVKSESDGTVKISIKVEHGLTLYKLFMAGLEYGANRKKFD